MREPPGREADSGRRLLAGFERLQGFHKGKRTELDGADDPE
jgi:hypothetical protein